MSNRYLRQLSQISIINFAVFFLVLLILATVQNKQAPIVKRKVRQVTVPTIRDIFGELHMHNMRSDCWIALEGHIYNVSTYFGSHPGGDQELEKYCGKDATQAFQTQDDQGKDHSPDAYAQLQQFLIQ
ncbi:hypothetical protein A2334_03655 [Candidatus Roizmanbacteria bacterium RIFOXYB2_FULL_38_10]|uniref:Cytochrome b5 heme-binding domain-containing protein n=1 Tax=Candidatus Roizmanbacteria bacterium RIFOXYD1_FULL_38_12 TaxID=1802093 RepID=A0A1F7L141_9BACT|nr:MAG: hypothetical protein A3K47_03190 [Candidatus Roizmanbacteria bacterium RIFOXYA2_FULL_38_14]OGK63771.1 MAG: hypothetical protein A3K27_03190 [Candidatus Roizmanbacteria bacterium RIFOXYA1_FULL_37_12]OGK65617.1 MAG: hypothetical protein A3K38_03190 [Candidatus Roizmanbacteria bacterium RIFOXYB1_FULL_40_23]OGK67495.1 MAG: hypothetical protein A2334_03655 [Candidatus Roizmanbacteria bacterium RIFOXYB2_FULL_38_10]OGK70022.1 MAG: hypothetical protein A3K21_03195 [Candidatus Roizmanbacteria ba